MAAVLAVVLGSGGGGSGNGGRRRAVAARAQGRRARARPAGERRRRRGRRAHAAGTSTVAAHASGHPGNASVPVLMYHVIAPPPAGAPFPGLYVTPSEFSEQMHALAAPAGTRSRSISWRPTGAKAPRWAPGKPIVVSFDNGYHSQYSQALPVLRSLGWVGDENIQLTGLPPSQGGSAAARSRD